MGILRVPTIDWSCIALIRILKLLCSSIRWIVLLKSEYIWSQDVKLSSIRSRSRTDVLTNWTANSWKCRTFFLPSFRKLRLSFTNKTNESIWKIWHLLRFLWKCSDAKYIFQKKYLARIFGWDFLLRFAKVGQGQVSEWKIFRPICKTVPVPNQPVSCDPTPSTSGASSSRCLAMAFVPVPRQAVCAGVSTGWLHLKRIVPQDNLLGTPVPNIHRLWVIFSLFLHLHTTFKNLMFYLWLFKTKIRF